MVEITVDQIITIGVALVTGIGGSFATLRATHWREDKKEKELALTTLRYGTKRSSLQKANE